MTAFLAAILVFQAGWFSGRWYTKTRMKGRTMRDVIASRGGRKHKEPPNVTEVA